jgi:hypothetical protein
MKGAQARADSMAITVGDTGYTMAGLAEVFVQSGVFRDVRGQAQAVVKILYGKEIGLSPMQAMMSIHFVEGRPEIAAATLGSLVKRHGKYDYHIVEHTEQVCEIEFFEEKNGQRVSLGKSRFSMEDAARAGLANRANWKAWPRNMLFARSMSNGVKWFALEAVGSVPIYTEGELTEGRERQVEPGEPEAKGETRNPYASQKKAPGVVVVGSEDCEMVGCWGPRGHLGKHMFEVDAQGLKTTPEGDRIEEEPGNTPKSVASGGTQDREGQQAGPDHGVSRMDTRPGHSGIRAIVDQGQAGADSSVSHAGSVAAGGSTGSPVSQSRVHRGRPSRSGSGADQYSAGRGSTRSEREEDSVYSGASIVGDESLRESERQGEPEVLDMHADAGQRVEAGSTSPQTFYVYDKLIETQGMTELQFKRSLELATAVDRARGKGHARGVLAKLLGCTISEATRKRLDEPTAAHYLDLLEQALEAGA